MRYLNLFALLFAILVSPLSTAQDQARGSSSIQIHEGAMSSSANIDGTGYYWTAKRSQYTHMRTPERYSHVPSNGIVTLNCVDGDLIGGMCFGQYGEGDGEWHAGAGAEVLRVDSTSLQCRDTALSEGGETESYFTIMAICTEGRIQPTFP